jgi:hypothetical protein
LKAYYSPKAHRDISPGMKAFKVHTVMILNSSLGKGFPMFQAWDVGARPVLITK